LQTVIPFRAWRYDPRRAGDLNRLIAPPYDVIDTALQSRLYARSPHNVVRVDLGVSTPSDSECDNQYTRAAGQLADWRERGILVRDGRPTVTFVQESFTGPDGRVSVRHGFLALMRLCDFDERIVFPHERTLSGPKEDRFRLLQATELSLSPVFLLYDLPDDSIMSAWRKGPWHSDPAQLVADPDAGPAAPETRLWPVSDPDLLDIVQSALAGGRFVIADGHHRYETALRYRDYRRAEAKPSQASEYALAYFSNMADPALAIYATHRLVRGLDPALVASLPQVLAATFAVERLTDGQDADSARAAITTYLETHPRSAFGLWGPGVDGAYGLRLTSEAAARAVEPEASPAYQMLDVTVLQSLVLRQALGITLDDLAAETYVTFFKDPTDAFARLAAGEFQAGLFMNPTRLDQIREVAFGGERMPQKATFFYPKLPTGLVFHDLNGNV
jgi:uncharacterized protein (DUF1015 family)